MAGATGSSISSELPQPLERQSQVSPPPQQVYSIRFINHALEPVQLSTLEEYTRPSSFLSPPSGYALKKNSGKRVVFTLAQKDIMILFHNRQASTGVRAEPKDVIACMRERGVDALKEQQIKSWWSTYNQKRKRSLNTRIPSLQRCVHPYFHSAGFTGSNTLASSFQTAAIHVPSTTVPVMHTTQTPLMSTSSGNIASAHSAGVPVFHTTQPPLVRTSSSSIPSTCPTGVHVVQTTQPPFVITSSSSIASTCPVGVPVVQTTHLPFVGTSSSSIPSTCPAGVPVVQTTQPPFVSATSSSIPSTCPAGVPVVQTTQPPFVSATSSSIPSTCPASVPVVQTIQPSLAIASSISLPTTNSTSVPVTTSAYWSKFSWHSRYSTVDFS